MGFVVGSLLLASLFDRLREGPWLAFSFLGMGLAGIAYSFTRSIPVAIAIVTLDGFMNAPGSIGRRVIIQRNTPRELRGRVSSAFFVSRDLLFVAGMALAGFADVINVRVLFFLISLLLVGAGVWVLVLPGLRQQRRRVGAIVAGAARRGRGARPRRGPSRRPVRLRSAGRAPAQPVGSHPAGA